MKSKKETIEESKALIEMYKAGYLDGYSNWNKPKTDDDWKTINKFYKLDFNKRFGKKITKHLKKQEKAQKKCKGVKKNG